MKPHTGESQVQGQDAGWSWRSQSRYQDEYKWEERGEDDQAGASNYLDNKYLVSHKYPHWAHHVSQSSPISDKSQTVPCLVL